MKIGDHSTVADERIKIGGTDFGPSPYELVSAGLSARTAMVIQMYARQKGWLVDNIEVHTPYNRGNANDCADCESNNSKIDNFQREVKLSGNVDELQHKRILEIADKCNVHKTLHNQLQIVAKLIG